MALAPEEVGQRIEAARKAAGYAGHQDFADAVSERLERRVNLRSVQRGQKGRDPKTGKSWLPRLSTLMEIADLLGVSRSYFVADEVPEATSDSEVHASGRDRRRARDQWAGGASKRLTAPSVVAPAGGRRSHGPAARSSFLTAAGHNNVSRVANSRLSLRVNEQPPPQPRGRQEQR